MLIVWTDCHFPLDYWLHVNAGRWMVETGQWISRDAFSHTIADQPVINQSWLAQLAMFTVHQIGGWRLAQFLAGVGYAVSLGIVVGLAYAQAGDARTAGLWGCLAVALMASNLGVRPQVFSALLFATMLYVLTVCRRPLGCLAGVTVLEILWTNLHGAFPLGVVLCGTFAVGTAVQRFAGSRDSSPALYASATVLCLASMFVQPQPQTTLSYVGGVSSKAAARQLEEWLPTSIGTSAGAALAVSVMAVIVYLAADRRALRVVHLLLLLLFGTAALTAQRMVLWWALILPATVGAGGRSALRVPAAAPTGWPGAWAAVALAVLLASATPWTRSMNPLLPAVKRQATALGEPVGAAGYVSAQQLAGRLFCPMPWGSYFTWHSHGKLKTFVDSRVDFFPDAVWADYLAILPGDQASLELIDRYQVDVVICDRQSQATLARRLANQPMWAPVYSDPTSQIFRRRPAAAAAERS